MPANFLGKHTLLKITLLIVPFAYFFFTHASFTQSRAHAKTISDSNALHSRCLNKASASLRTQLNKPSHQELRAFVSECYLSESPENHKINKEKS